jgi:two-component system LytT family response regulator
VRPEAPPLRTVIVDDEPLAVDGLRMHVQADPDLELVGEAGDGPAAIAALRRLTPDLVLLDVQMPEVDGFQVLEQLDPTGLPMVIFVTAHDRYALKAFEIHAIDYLLKPVSGERFRAALSRVKRDFWGPRTAELGDRLLKLIAGRLGKDATAWTRRLAVRDCDRTVFIDVDAIDWIQSADYYVEIHAEGRALLHREAMKRLEARLDPQQFVRVHRSTIVNQRRIREIRRDGRDLVVVLTGGTQLRVAPSYRERLERMLEG